LLEVRAARQHHHDGPAKYSPSIADVRTETPARRSKLNSATAIRQKVKDQRSAADDQNHEKSPLTLSDQRMQQISPD
jgi:hypothetical protein